ncbi:MAG: thiamine pyrophosphate-binding protein [Candidatus Ozemobacteraceae bacterium]
MNDLKQPQTTVVDLLLHYLIDEDVKYIFGIPGGPIMPLYEALFQCDRIKPVLSKHEQGAAFMADGYARATGKLGVCCSTTGPGATNLITGVACAFADSIPMLVITAQVSTAVFGKGAAQESTYYGVDIVSMFKPITKFSAMIHSPEKAGSIIRSALRAALSGRQGPAHINIPADFMKAMVPQVVIPSKNYRVESQQFDRAAVKRVSQLLIHAKKPIILAGNGVNLSCANNELLQLAEKLSIPVATSPKGKGAFPENHILSLGIFGFAGSALADDYCLSADNDVLLAVGTSLGELPTANWDERLNPSRALIHIDIDPKEIGKNYSISAGIIGDAKYNLRELNFQIDRELKLIEPPVNSNVEAIKLARSKHSQNTDRLKLESTEIPIHPQRLIKEMRDALPADAMLFVDIGTCMPWAIHQFTTYQPRTFFVNLGFGSMGHAISASIGAKLALPDRPVFALAGDAAFAMSGFEIHTAVELNLPVVWVIMNNGGHGMINLGERLQFGGRFCISKFSNRIRAAEMARSMGADATEITDPADLGPALCKAARATKPTLIEVITDITAIAPMGRRLQTLDDMFTTEP